MTLSYPGTQRFRGSGYWQCIKFISSLWVYRILKERSSFEVGHYICVWEMFRKVFAYRAYGILYGRQPHIEYKFVMKVYAWCQAYTYPGSHLFLLLMLNVDPLDVTTC